MAIDLQKLTPHKVSRDLSGYITYIYGAPKVGKTSLGADMPKPLLLAFERGYNALAGIIAQDISSWSEIKQVVRELKKPENKESFSTIIVDTVDVAAIQCEKYICGQNGVNALGEIPYGQGWTLLKKEFERIQEGLRSLTEEFIGEYPYYSTWIRKNEATFKDGTRVIYELNDDGKTVGYMMIHFSTAKCAKINGIYVFPNCQKRGYAKEALLQVLEELKAQKYDYAYIQTRIHNKIVVHMFESLHFDVIGQNYHNIEKQSNWVAVYDLWHRRNFDEMLDLAEQLYPGFSKN